MNGGQILNMRYCFIIDTPYQLFCVLNIVHAFKKNERRNDNIYDLYIGTNFNKAHKILENVKNEQIFDHVYKFNCERGEVRTGVFLRYLLKLVTVSRNERKLLECTARKYSRKVITKLFVSKRFLSVGQMAFGKKYNLDMPYDRLFASYFNPFVRNMALLSPNAEICCFEDGNGSYSENMFDFANKHEPDKKLAVAGIDIEKLRPKKLYVFKPEMCQLDREFKIRKLPLFYKTNREFTRITNQIFDYKKPSLYNGAKIIFLMTRDDEILILGGTGHGGECLQRYKEAVELLAHQDKDIIYRIHPRQKVYDIGEKTVDCTGVMWELLTPDCITDDCIIVSVCSTGAMSPKILYGIEPYVIMIGKYVYTGTEEEIAVTKMIDNFKKFYSNEKKLIDIRSKEQLINCIKKILKKDMNEKN